MAFGGLVGVCGLHVANVSRSCRDSLGDLLVEFEQFLDAIAQLPTQLTRFLLSGRDFLCTGAVGRERKVLAHSETRCFGRGHNGEHSLSRCLELACGRVGDGGCGV